MNVCDLLRIETVSYSLLLVFDLLHAKNVRQEHRGVFAGKEAV